MTKTLNYISYFTLVIATVFLAFVGYWLLYPYKPAVIKSIRVEQKEVAAGKTMLLDVDYCKYTNVTPVITTVFVDGVIFYLNDTSLTVPTGCGKNVVSITIPQEMASGTYSVRRTWSYQVNPLRKVVITTESNKFEITGSDAKRQLDQK